MNNIYRSIADKFIWSYSRIECFLDCPYRFFLKYFYGAQEEDRFYASYGSFLHTLIEQYYRGELSKDEMLFAYLMRFKSEVKGTRPSENTVKKYISSGVEYLQNFNPFPFNMIDVEKKTDFYIGDIPFTGYIDYLGEKDGEYYIVDNKSRDLKPRSKRIKPTAKDIELDSMLRQLYIYSAAVKQEYGKFPKALCFNCFRTGTFIVEPFAEDKYYSTIDWAKKTIENIKNTDDFYPNIEFFSCRYICGVSKECCYDQQVREGRGTKI